MQERPQGKENPVDAIHAAAETNGFTEVLLGPLLLDTHVLLDLWLFNDPRVGPLAARLAALDWVVSPALLQEWQYMVQRGVAGRPGRPWMGLPQPRPIDPPTTAAPWRCSDPDDQMFLDLAHALRPCTLWTRDKALLAHRKRAAGAGVTIESPEKGMQRLGWV